MTNTEAAMPTYAELHAALRLDESTAYAVAQLKAGKCLILTNGSDGRLIGNCGHDPREGRDWLTKLMESKVRKWD
ncbi:hypothetical protein ABT224_20100 [Streptomyces sp. NPDC001584]|uniref:hypothetical protein n=1 Tax=Streptomyces sp. NPDC001584 TaxID=3154521 RepID=UPI00332A5272